MDTEQYNKLVADLRARHLEKFNGGTINDEIGRILYEEIDKEFIAAGEPSQAEHEAQIVLKMILLAGKK